MLWIRSVVRWLRKMHSHPQPIQSLIGILEATAGETMLVDIVAIQYMQGRPDPEPHRQVETIHVETQRHRELARQALITEANHML